MAKKIISLALVAAFKRNDRKAIMEETLRSFGYEDEAEQVKEAGRVTVVLIDKTITPLVPAEEAEENNDEDLGNSTPDTDEGVDTGSDELTYADKDAEQAVVDHQFADIRKAIKKGKGKKALKLINEAKAAGARGSVLKDLKKQAKEL